MHRGHKNNSHRNSVHLNTRNKIKTFPHLSMINIPQSCKTHEWTQTCHSSISNRSLRLLWVLVLLCYACGNFYHSDPDWMKTHHSSWTCRFPWQLPLKYFWRVLLNAPTSTTQFLWEDNDLYWFTSPPSSLRTFPAICHPLPHTLLARGVRDSPEGTTPQSQPVVSSCGLK